MSVAKNDGDYSVWSAQRAKRIEETSKTCKEVLEDLGIPNPQCGMYVGLGWLPTVRQAFMKAIALGWDKKLGQVKQKFCQLRIYTDGDDSEEVKKVFQEACTACDMLCEDCGNLRQPRTGFGRALCVACEGKELTL